MTPKLFNSAQQFIFFGVFLESSLSHSLKKHFLLKWASIALLLVVLYGAAFSYLIDRRPFVEWTLIKSGPQDKKVQSHLIKLPDGKVFLINSMSASGSLLFFLKKQKIKDIDLVVLTSFQHSNFVGLNEILGAGIRVKDIKFYSSNTSSNEWDSILPLLRTKSLTPKALSSEESLYENGTTQLRFLSVSADSPVLINLIHGANKLLLISGEEEKLNLHNFRVNCRDFGVDVFVSDSPVIGLDTFLKTCTSFPKNLSEEEGTFKILFKGDSYKWKRGR